jgi:DNA-binding transcriptional regulator YiaG
MFAQYRLTEPARQIYRATAVDFDEDFEKQPTSIRENIGGRVLVYCVAGTFGLLLPAYVQASTATSSWSINQIEVDGSRTVVENAASATAEDIAHIRQTTKISVTELARVCGVSRQAVHEWIKGGPLSTKNAERISELAQAVDVVLASGVDASLQTLRRKVSGGMSILEAVQADGKVVNLARQFVDTLARESDQRKRLAARLTGRQKPQLSSTEFGTPHLNEDV